jgi:hypothetical protein
MFSNLTVRPSHRCAGAAAHSLPLPVRQYAASRSGNRSSKYRPATARHSGSPGMHHRRKRKQK